MAYAFAHTFKFVVLTPIFRAKKYSHAGNFSKVFYVRWLDAGGKERDTSLVSLEIPLLFSIFKLGEPLGSPFLFSSNHHKIFLSNLD